MLQRPSPAARRARRASRQRRWRERAKAGVMIVTVEIDDIGIDWLIRVPRTLAERDASDARAIGAAISQAIKISSRS
jgi:hypothetical protein